MSKLYKIPAHEFRITLPTIITLLRIFLIPIIVSMMALYQWGVAFCLFILAAATDGIDGMLARLRNEKTLLGAGLDALADKLLIIACFTTLAFVQSPLFTIPLWFLLLILFKETLLISGVLYISIKYGLMHIKPTMLGKLTMLAQVCFIIWLFACYFFHWLPLKTYYTMLGILIILVLISLLHYSLLGLRYIASCTKDYA